jgi:arabinose-5-phosphate isomerase
MSKIQKKNAVVKNAPKQPSAKELMACANAVIEQQVKGLKSIHTIIDDSFIKAVDLISRLKGRLIVSGMGKSGHIGTKMAATFASTGTPAYFVHPSEASHGDLGMITEHDAVLMLSNSGETAELRDLVSYTRRFNIPLLSMVRKKNSTLAKAADIAFVLPDIPEASPTGAPTTSTTQMLVLGDALAMTLLEMKGFTREDFHVLHPGGKLGKALMHVRELMHPVKDTPIVEESMPMSKVILVMTAKSFGCAAVVNTKGMLAGVITDGDLRRHMEKNLLGKKAGDVMTRKPISTTPDTLAAEVLHVMNSRKVTSLFVVENKKPVGIIHVHDCLRAGVM